MLFSSVKWSKHTDMYMITAPKVRVIFTQVRAYLLCLKTFEFVSFYTRFGMKFKQADCIIEIIFAELSCILKEIIIIAPNL